MTIFDPGYPKAQRIDCESGADINEITETATPGASSLTYGNGTYQYVWKTDRAWAGTCRRLVLGLNDSSSHSADFRLK